MNLAQIDDSALAFRNDLLRDSDDNGLVDVRGWKDEPREIVAWTHFGQI